MLAERIQILNALEKTCKVDRGKDEAVLAQGGRIRVRRFPNTLVPRETKGRLGPRGRREQGDSEVGIQNGKGTLRVALARPAPKNIYGGCAIFC